MNSKNHNMQQPFPIELPKLPLPSLVLPDLLRRVESLFWKYRTSKFELLLLLLARRRRPKVNDQYVSVQSSETEAAARRTFHEPNDRCSHMDYIIPTFQLSIKISSARSFVRRSLFSPSSFV